MTGAQPYVLARSCTEPDQEFLSLRAMAAAVVALRDAEPDRPAFTLYAATLTRNDLPGGRVVSVRLADGSCAGRGRPLAYAFLPRDHNGHETELLGSALAIAEAAQGEKAAAA